MQSHPGKAISKDSDKDRTPGANRPLSVWGKRQVKDHPFLGSCKQVNQQGALQYLGLSVHEKKFFLKLLQMENKLLLPGSCPTGAPRGGNQRQCFTRKFSANHLFPRKHGFRAAENVCQCRSTLLNSFDHYEKCLAPPNYQNEDFCLLNPSFHCPHRFQKLLTKGKR